jgi:hypothetical protein
VSRFRSSHHYAARSLANFGIKGTLAIYDSSAVSGFEVPTQTRGYNDGNFKSTALADAARHHGGTLIGPRPARFAPRNAPQDRRNHAVAPRVPAIRAKSQNIA